MGILTITTDVPGQIGVRPRRVKIVSTDNLATVTAASYLNPVSLEGYTIYNTDVIDMWYGAVGSVGGAITSAGTYEVFTPTISNGVITLVQWTNAGDVLLPVVSGDVPVFNGTTGQIKDSGAAMSNTSNTFFTTTAGSLTSGNFPTLSDTKGSLATGLPPSAASQNFVVVSPGSLTSGHILKTSDVNGTVADAGFAIHAATTATYAGGGTSNAFTTTNMTASSIVTAVILTSTNSVSITKAVPGTNTLTVTFSADPGAGTTVSWISVTPAG